MYNPQAVPEYQVIARPIAQGDDVSIRLAGTASPAAFTLTATVTDTNFDVQETITPVAPGAPAPYAIDVILTAAQTLALDPGEYFIWVRRTDLGEAMILALLKVTIYTPPWL